MIEPVWVLFESNLLKSSDFDLRNILYSEKQKNPKTGKPESIYTITKYKHNLDYNYQIISMHKNILIYI